MEKCVIIVLGIFIIGKNDPHKIKLEKANSAPKLCQNYKNSPCDLVSKKTKRTLFVILPKQKTKPNTKAHPYSKPNPSPVQSPGQTRSTPLKLNHPSHPVFPSQNQNHHTTTTAPPYHPPPFIPTCSPFTPCLSSTSTTFQNPKNPLHAKLLTPKDFGAKKEFKRP